MIIIRNFICIGKIGSRSYLYSLLCQTPVNLFLGIFMDPAAHSNRLLLQKLCQNHFCLFFTVSFQPAIDQIFRHGVLNRKKSHQILLSGWKLQIFIFPGYGPQNSVHKRLQIIKALSLSQLHRFIAHCTVRYTVHEFNLIHPAAQDFSDCRLHFIHSHLGIRINDIINQNSVFQSSLTYPGNKCPFLPGKELILGKGIANGNMAVSSLFFNFK